MSIYFCGEITIDNFEFYGEFDATGAAGAGLLSERRQSPDPKKVIVRQFGGAYLLARSTAVAWSLYDADGKNSCRMAELQPWMTFDRQFLAPRLEHLFKQPRRFDHNWQISYRLRKCGDNQFRVSPGGHEGFTAPIDNRSAPDFVDPKEIAFDIGRDVADLFVVNDAGENAENSQGLTDAIAASKDSWVVMKIIDPPKISGRAPPQLLAALLGDQREEVLGVVPADELRKAGAPISRSLSWERSVFDIIEQIQEDRLLPGNTPRHLVITFDYDAALYLRTRRTPGSINKRKVEVGTLVFSVAGSEGEFASGIEGAMPGAQSVFIGVLSALLYRRLEECANGKAGAPLDRIRDMLVCALVAKRRLLQAGFALTEKGVPFEMDTVGIDGAPRDMPRLYYSDGIFSLPKKQPRPDPDPFIRDERAEERCFCDPLSRGNDLAVVLNEHGLTSYELPSEPRYTEDWSIFESVTADLQLSDFTQFVIEGNDPQNIPICKFGKIKTAHVREIQDFRTIKKLLQSYLSNPPGSAKPLGIAVFGPPGAGKSFAVKNIVDTLPEALNKLVRDDRHECNLTALSDPEDLAHYFQLARNSVLRGKVPTLFFDEFDCTVGSAEFFWLKHFLAPLQDGEFRSDHIVHPIGRAIFVFAGGVCDTFEHFASVMRENSNQARKGKVEPTRPDHWTGEQARQKPDETQDSKRPEQVAAAQPNFKGVDFLSRLHGHIDIAGLSPNPKDESAALYIPANGGPTIVTGASYLMRRAFILRSLLENNVREIFSRGHSKRANIDPSVVDALLVTKKFSHGSRSMEAIIRMSSLEGSDRFAIHHLPPDEQLRMHVEGAEFSQYLEQDMRAMWVQAKRPPTSAA